MMAAIGWLVLSYLVGSIPTSFVAGRVFKGIDLRQQGSRNLGATNVYRVLGWKYAIPVGLFDAAKGAVPVWLFGPQVPDVPLFPLYCGLAAVIGHVFSAFVGFKGGKGVATASGVVLAIAPWALLTVLVVWVILVWLTGYVSVGSAVPAGGLLPGEFPGPYAGDRDRAGRLHHLEASREPSPPHGGNRKSVWPAWHQRRATRRAY
jgi:acyl phosphate:glycerol-3-phosphate acyltransferase